MRILFVNYSFPGIFGPLIDHMASTREHEIYFASSYKRRDYTIPGVRHLRLSPGHGTGTGADQELEGMLRAGHLAMNCFAHLREHDQVPDMVLASFNGGHAFFWDAAFPDAFRVVWTEDTDFTCGNEPEGDAFLIRSMAQSRQALGADLVVSLTASAPSRLGSLLKKGLDLPYAVNASWFAPHRVESLEHEGVELAGRGETILFHVDRTVVGDTDLTQTVVLTLVRRPADTVILLCDTQSTARAFQDLFSTLSQDMRRRLVCMGVVSLPRYRDLLALARVLIFPHRRFVPPSILLEAMSSATPVVLCNCAFEGRLVRDGHNVVVLDAPAPRDFVLALDTLLSRPDELAAIGANARRTVLAHFDYKKIIPVQAELLVRACGAWKRESGSGHANRPAEARGGRAVHKRSGTGA